MSDGIPEPAPIYLQLRDRILKLNPSELGLSPSVDAPQVWGVLMETGYPVGFATLVSLADGTTSLYYSTGGGIIGSGKYIPVSEASKALVCQAEKQMENMSLFEEFPLPKVGRVRFTVLTYSGIFAGEATEATLVTGEHPLAPLFIKGQQALEQLRLLAEKKRSDHPE